MDPTADKLAILELVAAYGDAVNRRDGVAWIRCWAEDAVWHIRDRRIEGTAAILQTWETAMAGYADVHFFSHLGRLSVTEDTASGRVYTQEFLRTTDGDRRTQIGEYDDLFARRGGSWVFTARSFRIRDTV